MSDQDQPQLVIPQLEKVPERLVSLVPSMTASLFDLDLADRLVGLTDFCPQPEEDGSKRRRVGGTRNPSIDRILDLKPDLILANQEENDREIIEQLKAAGLTVWTTFPKTIDHAIEILWALVNIMPSNTQATNTLLVMERSLTWARRAAEFQAPIPVFYPIWMDVYRETTWFMTINQSTYAHDVLHVCGAENVFADRLRRYPLGADVGSAAEEDPGERDCRYPRVAIDEILAKQPELILVPDEPYCFTQDHLKDLLSLFGDTPAGRSGNIRMVDGRLVHWHGTMLARALTDLPRSIQDLPARMG